MITRHYYEFSTTKLIVSCPTCPFYVTENMGDLGVIHKCRCNEQYEVIGSMFQHTCVNSVLAEWFDKCEDLKLTRSVCYGDEQ